MDDSRIHTKVMGESFKEEGQWKSQEEDERMLLGGMP